MCTPGVSWCDQTHTLGIRPSCRCNRREISRIVGSAMQGEIGAAKLQPEAASAAPAGLPLRTRSKQSSSERDSPTKTGGRGDDAERSSQSSGCSRPRAQHDSDAETAAVGAKWSCGTSCERRLQTLAVLFVNWPSSLMAGTSSAAEILRLRVAESPRIRRARCNVCVFVVRWHHQIHHDCICHLDCVH